MFVSVQETQIGEDSIEQRLDNYLFKLLKGVPKSYIYRIIRTGQVRINKKRAKPHTKLKFADIVRIPPLNLEKDVSKTTNLPQSKNSDWITELTLYEDKDMLILAKPSGMAVHSGSGIAAGLIEMLRRFKKHASDYYELVHRLDRETSGCLMIAKKRSALKELQKQLVCGEIKKTYLALLAGYLAQPELLVDYKLDKNVKISGERVVKVNHQSGKDAATVFKRVACYEHACLVMAQLLTGRTHQIRVHAQAIGHPIIGDSKYGCKQMNAVHKKNGLKRLFLHARELKFFRPSDKKEMTINCPLPKELELCLQNLKEH